MLVERTVLLNPLALCLVVDGGRKRADVGIRPYKRHPVGADALVGPRQPPGQRQRKENARVSGTSLEVSSRPLPAGRGAFNYPRFAVCR